MRCEHCASLWFPPESEEGVRTLDEAAGHDCPSCAAPLVAGWIEDRGVAHCLRCKGILTSTRTLYEIVNIRRMKAKGPFAPERPVDPGEFSRQLACPSCREPMHVHPYYGPGNAVIDTCGDCLLVWLDHSELSVIVSAPASHS